MDNAESLRAMAQALDLGCTFLIRLTYGHGLRKTAGTGSKNIGRHV
jgi:hypothetical protein